LSHQPRKRFGQNFLHSPGVIRRIIDALNPAPDDHFVEIGPGQGAITQPLSQRAGRLDVIEIDRDLAAALAATPWASAIHIHTADALTVDLATLASGPASLRLAGNLPYNISTPLLFHMLDQQRWWRDAHVMLQKEVVERMAAAPGSRVYGRLTVALAARCEVTELFTIKPGAFRPAPRVQSAFARLTPLPAPLIAATAAPAFDALLRAAFGQRRKQLVNSLETLLSAAEIEKCGVDPTNRPEQLDVHAFVALANAVVSNGSRLG
jgi:16S rRNA (adenine1518-N6/adenine1519-N6)-dimethyltransferase